MSAYNSYSSTENSITRIDNRLRTSDSPPLINNSLDFPAYNLNQYRRASLGRGGVSSATSKANKPLRSRDDPLFNTSLGNSEVSEAMANTILNIFHTFLTVSTSYQTHCTFYRSSAYQFKALETLILFGLFFLLLL